MPTPRVNPPAFLRHWQTWALLMGLMLVPFFLKIPISLRRDPVISILGDRLHIVLLAAVTLLVYWKGPLRGKLLWTAVATAGIGAAIEFVQTLVGREALWHDFFMDLQGIGLIVGFILWRGHRNIFGFLLVATLAIVIPLKLSFLPGLMLAVNESRASFPLLADFNTSNSSTLWHETYNAKVDISFDTGGVLQITGGPPSKWPGADMGYFPHDWSDYKELVVDARLVSTHVDQAKMCIRIDDFQGRIDHSWITDRFSVTQQWASYSVPIVDRQMRNSDRILNLTDIDRILLFLPTPKDTIKMEFDNLRLR